jgi:beta-phosphoglucomutase-like phosphatase (HAD superfamily)
MEAMKELEVTPEQTVMLDDLKPGVEMAIAAVRSIRQTTVFLATTLHD